jgi:hypothetical protein
MFTNITDIEKVFIALSEQLESLGINHLAIVVCGGIALNVLGYVRRTTKDVDVIAFIENNVLVKAKPLKPLLLEAARRVQGDFNLPENWLNAGPADIMDFGLPEGLIKRAEIRKYGKILTIHFLSRYDQIHFKLHAAVDQGGKHYDDLLALKPAAQELEAAARWTMTHDVSDGYRKLLKSFIDHIGHKDVADKL